MYTKALRANSVLRESYPAGFQLGSDYRPHISIVQMFVPTTALPQVLAEVADVVRQANPTEKQWKLLSNGMSPGPQFGDGISLPKYNVATTPALARLQATLQSRLSKYNLGSGGADAFLVTPAEAETAAKSGQPAINPASVNWVNTFASTASGPNYAPHVTLGAATNQGYQTLTATVPFTNFTFPASSVAVCHLGNFDTCHAVLGQTVWK